MSFAEYRVNLLTSLNDHVGKLVNPALQVRPVEFARQRIFLATRLAVPLGALVIAPLCLLAGNGPAWWEAGALAWLLLPFGAVVLVSRTGDLKAGEALSVAAWIGLALTLTVGSGSGVGLGLLLLVPLEAALSTGSLYVTASLWIAVLTAVGLAIGLTPADPASPLTHFTLLARGIVAASACYGGTLAFLALRLQDVRQHHERLGRERYRVLADVLDDVVMRYDRSGAVVFASPTTDRLFGIRPRDLQGRGFFEHIHVADRPVFLKLVADVAADGGARTETLRVRTGKTVPSQQGDFDEPVFAWVELRARTFDVPRTGPGHAAVVALMRDITAQKLNEQALEAARESAARSDAGRDLFLASVSHELRTPLNAIIGFAELLASETLAPSDAGKRREYASIIHQAGHHLLAVVNSILDASKIESGSFDIVPESFELPGLIGTCCDMVGLKAEQAGITLIRDLPPNLQDVVGDKRACKQILLNLLSNALKFTPAAGRVTVGARPDGNSVLLFVSDTGIGVGARDLPRLGDPFFQARGSYDRPHDGTGLGLSVVRGLVGLHGGSISIESAPGEGTRVSVRLPFDCRRTVPVAGTVTKIETIPRYHLTLQQPGGVTDVARVHKIA